MKGYPKWFVPALIGTLVVLFATGGLLAPTTLAVHAELPLTWRLPGPARLLCAALHAAGGFAALALVGALWALHMRSGWRRRLQRRSGVLLATTLMLLAVSALAIYYAGDERVSAAAALSHLILGVALLLPFGWHSLRGRRAARITRDSDRPTG